MLLPEKTLTNSDTFQVLVDEGLLHRLQGGVADQNPGETYDVYSLDYAAYLPKLADGTLKDDDLTDRVPNDPANSLAPFHDKRRIRRIVVG